jgi:hypothetical protein
MPAGKNADHQLIENFFLANHHASNLLPQSIVGILQFGQTFQVGIHYLINHR